MVLISEMLLRKTKAESVDPIVQKLFARHDSMEALARSRTRTLEHLLRPLGLHRIRARAIKETASRITSQHGGKVPRTYDELVSLPHVGRYTANSVLCVAFRKPRPVVDANVVRVFERVFGTERPVEVHKADALWDFAEDLQGKRRPREFNWSLLDLGSAICSARKPSCSACPVRRFCKAHNSEGCACGQEKASA